MKALVGLRYLLGNLILICIKIIFAVVVMNQNTLTLLGQQSELIHLHFIISILIETFLCRSPRSEIPPGRLKRV